MKDNTTWPDLLQDPKPIRVHHCNNAEQIQAATDIIQQSTSQLYRALHDRAKLLANNAQFAAALRDATAMRKLRPTVGLGYLCEGDVYCRQGRLRLLSPAPETQRRSNISNTRIDFISQLPVDIVSTNIIPRFMPTLLSTGCCPYLYVSHTWQQRILQHGLSFQMDYEDKLLLKDHQQLIQYAPYVKSLELPFSMEMDLVCIFSLAKFSSLKMLKLSNFTRECQLNGLRMVADTLTHLDLWDLSPLKISDIMKTCPNLVSLKYQYVNAVIPSSIGPHLQYPHLTHLDLLLPPETITDHDNLIRVLRMFPGLVYLKIGAMPDSYILPLLQKHCRHLKMIDFGRGLGAKESIIDDKDKRMAVVRLASPHFYNQDDMITFLLQHCRTLRELDLAIDVIPDGNSSFAFSDGEVINREVGDGAGSVRVSFPGLHTLHLTKGYHSQGPFLQWIIDHAPQLRSISIPERLFVKEMVPGMNQLAHLTTLHIYEVAEFKKTDSAIGDFVQHHTDLGEGSTFEHIKISFNRDQVTVASWVESMSCLKRLKKLELLAATMMCDWSLFFVYLGKGCPSLEELTLGNGSALIDGSFIHAFRTYPKLSSLYIGASSLIEYDLRCLVSIPSLEHVYLRYPLPEPTANYLHERGITTHHFAITTSHDLDNKW